MADSFDLQRVIADAWAAGYAAREDELVYRRRSSAAHRQAEIARLTEQVLGSIMTAPKSVDSREQALSS